MLCKEKEKENIKLQSVVLCANLSQIFFCNGPQKIFVALFDNIQLLPSLSHDTLHTWRLDFNGSLNKFGQKWRCCQLVSKYGMKVNLIPNIIAWNEMCLRSSVFIFHFLLRLNQSEISMLPRTPTRQTRGRRSPSTAHLNSFSRDSSSSTFGKIIFTRLTLWRNRHWHVSPNRQKLISVRHNRPVVIIHSR